MSNDSAALVCVASGPDWSYWWPKALWDQLDQVARLEIARRAVEMYSNGINDPEAAVHSGGIDDMGIPAGLVDQAKADPGNQGPGENREPPGPPASGNGHGGGLRLSAWSEAEDQGPPLWRDWRD